jgi:hypothetical protein
VVEGSDTCTHARGAHGHAHTGTRTHARAHTHAHTRTRMSMPANTRTRARTQPQLHVYATCARGQSAVLACEWVAEGTRLNIVEARVLHEVGQRGLRLEARGDADAVLDDHCTRVRIGDEGSGTTARLSGTPAHQRNFLSPPHEFLAALAYMRDSTCRGGLRGTRAAYADVAR